MNNMRHLFPTLLLITLLLGFISCGNKEEPAPVIVNVESVSLDRNALPLSIGETVVLQATVKPDNATYKTVAWSSSNTSVATVDKEGKVVAVAEGRAIITAKVGVHYATCEVTVTDSSVPVESITLNKRETTIAVGESELLIATILPENAYSKEVTWKSSDTSVATVTEGVVTAIAEGTATITATADGKFATCLVKVAKNVIVAESVTLDKTSWSLYVGESFTLTATVHPDEATDKTVSWSSSAPSIVTVDKGVVNAHAAGIATITVVTNSGGHKATCTVEVKDKEMKGDLEGLTEENPKVEL